MLMDSPTNLWQAAFFRTLLTALQDPFFVSQTNIVKSDLIV